MKVYVAGSTRDIERIKGVIDVVRAFGHEITFDWTGPEGEIRKDISWDTAKETGARVSQREIEAAGSADLTILIFPSTGGGLGCWVEMGATLARGGEVWVVEPKRDSVFWQHPNVRRFEHSRAFMDSLAQTAIRTAAITDKVFYNL
jgi:hypothetical protein